jgi:hypothetical protein
MGSPPSRRAPSVRPPSPAATAVPSAGPLSSSAATLSQRRPLSSLLLLLSAYVDDLPSACPLAARTGVSLRNLVGVPCLEPPSAGSTMPTTAVCGVLVLYSRCELPQSDTFNVLLHALGSAAAAAYRIGLSANSVETRGGPPSTSYKLRPPDGRTSSLSWLLLASARALKVDLAEHWAAWPSASATTDIGAGTTGAGTGTGGGVHMTAEQLLVSERVHGLPESVLATGTAAEALRPFSLRMSRAALIDGKLFWCKASALSKSAEGMPMAMQTAVGLPLRNHLGGGSTFVLYSLGNLEQTTDITYFLAQLQVLAAAAPAAFAPQPPRAAATVVAPDTPARLAAPKMLACAPTAPPPLALAVCIGAGPPLEATRSGHLGPSAVATAVSMDAERRPSSLDSLDALDFSECVEDGPADLSQQQEVVMSTEQVLSLIDCLGDGGAELAETDVAGAQGVVSNDCSSEPQTPPAPSGEPIVCVPMCAHR